jgi:hypothetical protein
VRSIEEQEPNFTEEIMDQPEVMEQINFGVRYQHLRDSETNEETAISSKHWVLVFTPPSNEVSITVELAPGDDPGAHIYTPLREHEGPYEAFPLGTFFGRLGGIEKVLTAHPQRGTMYSSCFNNCQHYVAIFLLFLQAFAKSTPGRSLVVEELSRYEAICKVLPDISSPMLWNRANECLDRLASTVGVFTGLYPLISMTKDMWK